MGEFLGELFVKAITAVVEALAEFICVQTAAVILPIVSFGTLTTQDRFPHPPAYGERRPVVVGPSVAALFGFAFWTLATVAVIVFLR